MEETTNTTFEEPRDGVREDLPTTRTCMPRLTLKETMMAAKKKAKKKAAKKKAAKKK
jgi:hypothetical protein